MKKGNLFILSGPSGVGKNTIENKLLKRIPELKIITTYTTRAPRGKEKNKLHYHFVSKSQFKKMINEEAFLEWAIVHGQMYGTSKKDVLQSLKKGNQILINIDVQGALQIKKQLPDCNLIFLQPESINQLRDHLQKRGDVSEDQIKLRLKNATAEMKTGKKYDHIFVNVEGKINKVTSKIAVLINDIISSG